jgi:hypothetical protein
VGFTAFSLDLLLLLTVGLVPAALDDLTAELVPEERVAVLAEERVAVPPALELERTVLLPAERVALELAALLERVVPELERVPELTELLRVALLPELERVPELTELLRVALLPPLERVPELTELLRVALLLERDALLLTVPPTDLEVVAEERDTPELELERETPEL